MKKDKYLCNRLKYSPNLNRYHFYAKLPFRDL